VDGPGTAPWTWKVLQEKYTPFFSFKFMRKQLGPAPPTTHALFAYQSGLVLRAAAKTTPGEDGRRQESDTVLSTGADFHPATL